MCVSGVAALTPVCVSPTPLPQYTSKRATAGTTRASTEQLNQARRRAWPRPQGVGLEGMPGGHTSPPEWEVGCVTTAPLQLRLHLPQPVKYVRSAVDELHVHACLRIE